jgi:hypothetical protein
MFRNEIFCNITVKEITFQTIQNNGLNYSCLCFHPERGHWLGCGLDDSEFVSFSEQEIKKLLTAKMV